MKALLILVTAALMSCTTYHKARIIETGERARVADPQNAYVSGDTVIVFYSYSYNEWCIDENWIPFAGNRHAPTNGIIYTKAVIQ